MILTSNAKGRAYEYDLLQSTNLCMDRASIQGAPFVHRDDLISLQFGEIGIPINLEDECLADLCLARVGLCFAEPSGIVRCDRKSVPR